MLTEVGTWFAYLVAKIEMEKEPPRKELGLESRLDIFLI